MTSSAKCALFFVLSAVSSPAMSIVLNTDAGLTGNTAALAAFQRAATTWSGMFSDNFTVNIDAGLASLGDPRIIGQASSTLVQAGYNTIRNRMVLDAADEASNGIVAALPTAAQFVGTLPAGFGFAGTMLLTQANANALGFGVNFGPDGAITFNNAFSFDYDNSDGVGANQVDFETVALHEIGHVLGFISVVDTVDLYRSQGQTTTQLSMTPLDLFRFANGQIPLTAAQFTSTARNYVPGASTSFSDTVNSWGFSTGRYTGDENQASHWKDDDLNAGTLIGVMDPTLPNGKIERASAADRRALDLIGYDLVVNPVPEPAAFALMGAGLVAVSLLRRRRQ